MTTNPKPLLTRAAVQDMRRNGFMPVAAPAALNTIASMVELLEAAHECSSCNPNAHQFNLPCNHCRRAEFLQTFNATGGEGS